MNGDGSTLFDGEGPWALRLLAITDGCAPSMHEPELDAQVVGNYAHAPDCPKTRATELLVERVGECYSDLPPSVRQLYDKLGKALDGNRAYLEGSLDNAMGDEPGCGLGSEFTVSLVREVEWDDTGDPTDIRTEHFNLATLIAFARIGAAAVAKSSS